MTTEEHRSQKKNFLLEAKEIQGCVLCGEHRRDVLCYHHALDIGTDRPRSRNILNGKGSFKNTIKEMLKCVVLCQNCHTTIHVQGLHQLFAGWFNIFPDYWHDIV